jgi:GntR family transcriptional regulator
MIVPPWDPVPDRLLYLQLAEHITARIKAGDLEPGRRLPPERELAAEYGVAYHTVRNAMRVLREAGLIVSIQGRGTYVRSEAPPSERDGGASDEGEDL